MAVRTDIQMILDNGRFEVFTTPFYSKEGFHIFLNLKEAEDLPFNEETKEKIKEQSKWVVLQTQRILKGANCCGQEFYSELSRTLNFNQPCLDLTFEWPDKSSQPLNEQQIAALQYHFSNLF